MSQYRNIYKVLFSCLESQSIKIPIYSTHKVKLDNTQTAFTILSYLPENQASISTWHNVLVNIPVNNTVTYRLFTCVCCFLPFCCQCVPFCHLFYCHSLQPEYTYIHASWGARSRFPKPQQIDLSCLLDSFVFGLAQMKALLSLRTH